MDSNIPRRHAIYLIAGASVLFRTPASGANRTIDESGFVPIGGIPQWISIQGRDAANPAILYLHGGPAEAQSPFLKEFLAWETDFTVVNWDQRGSGKTFGRNGTSTPGMSTPQAALEQMCQDVRETAEYACQRLGKQKVILVGQSWGTVLGLAAAKRWPQLFSAFVGTGFFVSWGLSLRSQARSTRRQATAENDQVALKALNSTANLPDSDMNRIVAANKYRWAPSDLEYLKIQQAFVGPPPLPAHGDVADWIGGSAFSIPKLLPIVFSYDARKEGFDIPVPFFVIQGRDDHVTPFEAAEAFLADVHAPAKKLVAIAGGHFACFTNPAGFVGALRQLVRPIALTDG